jgi:hypothetical protein
LIEERKSLYADDIAIFNTTPLLDTTNIFLIDNCHDIPKDTILQYWGIINGKWDKSKLVDSISIIENGVRDGVIGGDFDTVYPDWKTTLDSGQNIYHYEKYFRLIETPPIAGNSGGPHGFFFNRKTGKIDVNELCFAICFTTGSGINIYDKDQKAIHYGVVISVSRWIDWLKGLGMKINIAHYNVNDSTISIVPNTIPGGSSSGKKTTPGGNRGSSSSGKTPTKFRASRRKQIKKAPSI